MDAEQVEWGWSQGQCWSRVAGCGLGMWAGDVLVGRKPGVETRGAIGAKCVRGVKWPTVSEVLGGTHSQWGLGEGLEPPHTLAPRIGPVESS